MIGNQLMICMTILAGCLKFSLKVLVVVVKYCWEALRIIRILYLEPSATLASNSWILIGKGPKCHVASSNRTAFTDVMLVNAAVIWMGWVNTQNPGLRGIWLATFALGNGMVRIHKSHSRWKAKSTAPACYSFGAISSCGMWVIALETLQAVRRASSEVIGIATSTMKENRRLDDLRIRRIEGLVGIHGTSQVGLQEVSQNWRGVHMQISCKLTFPERTTSSG